eukprot:gene3599-5584_t
MMLFCEVLAATAAAALVGSQPGCPGGGEYATATPLGVPGPLASFAEAESICSGEGGTVYFSQHCGSVWMVDGHVEDLLYPTATEEQSLQNGARVVLVNGTFVTAPLTAHVACKVLCTHSGDQIGAEGTPGSVAPVTLDSPWKSWPFEEFTDFNDVTSVQLGSGAASAVRPTHLRSNRRTAQALGVAATRSSEFSVRSPAPVPSSVDVSTPFDVLVTQRLKRADERVAPLLFGLAYYNSFPAGPSSPPLYESTAFVPTVNEAPAQWQALPNNLGRNLESGCFWTSHVRGMAFSPETDLSFFIKLKAIPIADSGVIFSTMTDVGNSTGNGFALYFETGGQLVLTIQGYGTHRRNAPFGIGLTWSFGFVLERSGVVWTFDGSSHSPEALQASQLPTEDTLSFTSMGIGCDRTENMMKRYAGEPNSKFSVEAVGIWKRGLSKAEVEALLTMNEPFTTLPTGTVFILENLLWFGKAPHSRISTVPLQSADVLDQVDWTDVTAQFASTVAGGVAADAVLGDVSGSCDGVSSFNFQTLSVLTVGFATATHVFKASSSGCLLDGIYTEGTTFGTVATLNQDNGLIAFWALNHSADEYSAHDLTLQATPAGSATAWVQLSAADQGAAVFDGTAWLETELGKASRVQKAFTEVQILTVCAWVLTGGSNDTSVVTATGSGAASFYLNVSSSATLIFGVGDDVVEDANLIGIDVDTWTHVCGVLTHDSLKIAVNGSFTQEVNRTGSPAVAAPTKVVVGREFEGSIYRVALYNIAFTEDRLASAMTGGQLSREELGSVWYAAAMPTSSTTFATDNANSTELSWCTAHSTKADLQDCNAKGVHRQRFFYAEEGSFAQSGYGHIAFKAPRSVQTNFTWRSIAKIKVWVNGVLQDDFSSQVHDPKNNSDCKMWVDGIKARAKEVTETVQSCGGSSVDIQLNPGWNSVLIKVINYGAQPGFIATLFPKEPLEWSYVHPPEEGTFNFNTVAVEIVHECNGQFLTKESASFSTLAPLTAHWTRLCDSMLLRYEDAITGNELFFVGSFEVTTTATRFTIVAAPTTAVYGAYAITVKATDDKGWVDKSYDTNVTITVTGWSAVGVPYTLANVSATGDRQSPIAITDEWEMADGEVAATVYFMLVGNVELSFENADFTETHSLVIGSHTCEEGYCGDFFEACTEWDGCLCRQDVERYGYWDHRQNCKDCLRGYAGAACSRTCPGQPYREICGGHGWCDDGVYGTGECTCDASPVTGFWGMPDCVDCKAGYYGKECRLPCGDCGQGTCTGGMAGAGECACNDARFDPAGDCKTCTMGYVGNACEVECPNRCSDRGVCNLAAGAAVCACFPGTGGVDCSVDCPVSHANSCGGPARGTCLDDGTCKCNTKYTGPACERCEFGLTGSLCLDTCPGMQLNGLPCSGHGVCEVSGSCTCESMFQGLLCDKLCSAFAGDTVPCGSRGECLSNGECSCARDSVSGYWAGDRCEACLATSDAQYVGEACTIACPNPGSKVCSGHGYCVLPPQRSKAECVCYSGFCNAQCQDTCAATCPAQTYGVSCTACPCAATDGSCDGDTGQCSCFAGKYGADCATTCDPPCTNGACVLDTAGSPYCKCFMGYYGGQCTQVCGGAASVEEACARDPRRCRTDGTCDCSLFATEVRLTGNKCEVTCKGSGGNGQGCSGHGTCQGDGSCICYGDEHGGYWDGEGCDVCRSDRAGPQCTVLCINGRPNGFSCACNDGWAGGDCTVQCNGTVSSTGKCVCGVGMWGEQCLKACPAECSQNNNANPGCDQKTGACLCKANFAGYVCDECLPWLFSTPGNVFSCDATCCSGNGKCDDNGAGCDCFESAEHGFWTGSLASSACAGGPALFAHVHDGIGYFLLHCANNAHSFLRCQWRADGNGTGAATACVDLRDQSFPPNHRFAAGAAYGIFVFLVFGTELYVVRDGVRDNVVVSHTFSGVSGAAYVDGRICLSGSTPDGWNILVVSVDLTLSPVVLEREYYARDLIPTATRAVGEAICDVSSAPQSGRWQVGAACKVNGFKVARSVNVVSPGVIVSAVQGYVGETVLLQLDVGTRTMSVLPLTDRTGNPGTLQATAIDMTGDQAFMSFKQSFSDRGSLWRIQLSSFRVRGVTSLAPSEMYFSLIVQESRRLLWGLTSRTEVVLMPMLLHAVDSVEPAVSHVQGGTPLTLTGIAFVNMTAAPVCRMGVTTVPAVVVSATVATCDAPESTPCAEEQVLLSLRGNQFAGDPLVKISRLTLPTIVYVSSPYTPAAQGTAVTVAGRGFTQSQYATCRFTAAVTDGGTVPSGPYELAPGTVTTSPPGIICESPMAYPSSVGVSLDAHVFTAQSLFITPPKSILLGNTSNASGNLTHVVVAGAHSTFPPIRVATADVFGQTLGAFDTASHTLVIRVSEWKPIFSGYTENADGAPLLALQSCLDNPTSSQPTREASEDYVYEVDTVEGEATFCPLYFEHPPAGSVLLRLSDVKNELASALVTIQITTGTAYKLAIHLQPTQYLTGTSVKASLYALDDSGNHVDEVPTVWARFLVEDPSGQYVAAAEDLPAVSIAEIYCEGGGAPVPVALAAPGGGPAQMAVDGDAGTYWEAAANSSAVFEVAAGGAVDGYSIVTSPSESLLRWTIDGSDDLAQWVTIDNQADADVPDSARPPPRPDSKFPASYRYLRITIHKAVSRGKAGIAEDGTIWFRDVPLPEVRHGSKYKVRFLGDGLAEATVDSITMSTPYCEAKAGVTSYQVMGTGTCAVCPDHAVCNGTEHILPVEGYWRASGATLEIYACPISASCLGPTCAEHSEGTLCAGCEEGYGKNFLEGLCFECSDHPWLSVVIAALVLSLFAVTWVVLHALEIAVDQLVLFRIFIDYIQVISNLANVLLPLPDSSRDFYATAGTFSFDLKNFKEIDCFAQDFDITSREFMLITAGLPLLALPLSFVVLLSYMLLRKHLTKTFKGKQRLATDAMIDGLIPKKADTPNFRGRHERTNAAWIDVVEDVKGIESSVSKPSSGQAVISTGLCLVYLLYLMILYRSTVLLDCIEVEYVAPCRNGSTEMPYGCSTGGETAEIIRHDPSLDCTGENTSYRIAAVATVLCYGVVLPVVLWFVIQSYRVFRGDRKTAATFPFLLVGYKKEAGTWGLLVLLRKFVFVMIMTFASEEAFQAYALMWFMAGMLLLHIWKQPFVKRLHNAMETMCLGSVVFNLNVGVLFLIETDYDTLLTVVLFSANIGTSLVLFGFLVKGFVDYCRPNHREPEIKKPRRNASDYLSDREDDEISLFEMQPGELPEEHASIAQLEVNSAALLAAPPPTHMIYEDETVLVNAGGDAVFIAGEPVAFTEILSVDCDADVVTLQLLAGTVELASTEALAAQWAAFFKEKIHRPFLSAAPPGADATPLLSERASSQSLLAAKPSFKNLVPLPSLDTLQPVVLPDSTATESQQPYTPLHATSSRAVPSFRTPLVPSPTASSFKQRKPCSEASQDPSLSRQPSSLKRPSFRPLTHSTASSDPKNPPSHEEFATFSLLDPASISSKVGSDARAKKAPSPNVEWQL